MSRTNDYKDGYRDAMQYAVSEINSCVEDFVVDKNVADRIIENLKKILWKVWEEDSDD